MTPPLLSAIGQKSQRLSLLIALLLFSPFTLQADEKQGEPALLILPSFHHPAISRYLPGAKRTLITTAVVSKSGEITYLKADTFSTPEEWDHFIQDARETLMLQLATLNPTMVRDEHGVIQMAVVSSDTPITASLILLPGFLNHFSAIFGPELLIVIPAQNKICVFPNLANHLPQMISAIRDDSIISSMPASTEIFELNRHGLQAVGIIDPDDD